MKFFKDFLPRIVLLATLAGVAGPLPVKAATNQPNIIFILTDDMGWGDLGVFYQNSRNFAVNRAAPAFITPKLDTLAAEGVQLRRHYCPAPVCAPSRASLILGVHQGHANVRDSQFDKALENNHTLGTVLKQAGYKTAMIGKYGLQGSGLPAPARPELRGFDYFFGYLEHGDAHYHYPKETGANVYDGITEVTADLDKCYSTDFIAARTKKWIVDQHAASPAQPFFIYLAFTAPHARLDVPTQAYPAGSGTNGGLQWLGTPGAMINTASGSINSWIHPDYASATYDSDNNSGTAEVAWPDYAKRHATMMRRIDDAVADLIQTLKDLNLDTNTLVVFTSDNGPHNEAGTGGSYTYNPTFFDSFGPMDGIKRDTWEGGMREPTMVRWPGHIAAGTTNFTASQFHDWLPTFCDFAGLAAPARSDGVSLVPTLTGVGTQRQSTIYVEYNYPGTTPSYTEFEASRRGATRNQEQIIHLDGYKGIRYNIAASTDNFKIYDTLNDAKETTDLAGSSSYFADLQQRMKDRVLQVRMPGGGVSRPYDSALVPPVAVTSVVTGLDYRAFEAAFPWVPDFTPLASVTNGTCTGVDLAVRTRDNDIGLLYTGYLDVPSNGTYTVYLTTDGRAFLRLHDASVVDADFGYTGGTEISATINLAAGRHPLRLGYVRGTGGTPSISLQWSGPGIAKQTIPTTNLLRANTAANLPPTAANDSATTSSNTPVTINVLANDLGGSGPGPLRVISVGTPANGAAATNLAGQIVYTPNAGFVGTNTFSYTMTDGLSNATATVTVAVLAAIPPTATDDSASTARNTAVTINVLANDALGGGAGPLRVTSIGAPSAGAAVTNLSGQIVYTPNASFLGDDTFTYTVTDGSATATATVRVKVFFADGLIWFPFNQTSGLTTEDAAGAFTGNLTGFSSDPAQWIAGKWNRAIVFNGAGNYVAISNFTGILGASNRTCAAWVKTTGTGQMPIIAWGPNLAGNKWTFLLQNGHARIEATSGYLEGTRTVNDGNWHHVAVTFTNDGTPDIIESKLYIDGTAETSFTASLTRTVNTTASGNVTVGADIPSAQNRYFTGQIDEPRIYNRALSAAEIAALYAATNQSAAAWHRRYFGNGMINWMVDDDGDGGLRLLEYAMGAEPWIFDKSSQSVSGELVGGRLQVHFPRRVSGSSELVYTVQVSRDLWNWNTLAAAQVSAVPIPGKPGFEYATFQTDATVNQESTQFIRLSVSLP